MFGKKKKIVAVSQEVPVQPLPQPQKVEEVAETVRAVEADESEEETEETESVGDTEEVTEEQVLSAIANLSHRVARIEHFLRLDY